MKPLPALIAALLLTGSLGSIHAFSVIIVPLEERFGASRGDVSLAYSLALISLTVAVLFGHRIYHRLTPALMGAGACLVAATGLVLAAVAPALVVVYAAYGVLFGFANGVGYGFSLIAAARAYPKRQGMAMGLVTACYAVGAIVFAQVLKLVHEPHGLTTALIVHGLSILACGAVAGLLLSVSRLRMGHSAPSTSGGLRSDVRPIILMWLGFGFGCMSGIIAFSHAAGVVTETGGSGRQAVIGVMLVGFGNAVGGLMIAGLADRIPLRLLLVGLPALSMAGLAALALLDGPGMAIVCLGVVGLAYGAIAAIYPVVTSRRFGIDRTPRIYGLIFTAWGVTGFAGPWISGVIYDVEGGYRSALALAGLAALISAAAGACLRLSARERVGTAQT
ncbi:MAG: MFS transporter [Pseudomonadota bacterium]